VRSTLQAFTRGICRAITAVLHRIATEIRRLRNATRFSLQGFRHAWREEAAFRFEVLLAAVLVPTALLLHVGPLERVALIGSVLLVLIVELLNSALEATIDRIGTEHHPLSGRGKDMGSAAVFVALVLAGLTWTLLLWPF
jgi:diacylglycerol kinase (ATP)